VVAKELNVHSNQGTSSWYILFWKTDIFYNIPRRNKLMNILRTRNLVPDITYFNAHLAGDGGIFPIGSYFYKVSLWTQAVISQTITRPSAAATNVACI
jgi:hypothetical protein